jgi:CO/xanthine dehydrogenase Mo-binding subunit
MPYDAAKAKEFDKKTIKRNVVDNPAVHDKSGKWIMTGRAEFAADHFTGHKYFGVAKLATVMHAKIKSVDFSEALKIPGVIDVVTVDEVPTWSDHVLWYGKEVAGVIADNWYTAIRATEAIKVEYDVLPAMFDPDVAIAEDGKDGTANVGLIDGTNLHQRTAVVRGGGAAEGFKNVDWDFTFEYPWTTSYAHNELEAHQSIGWWIGDEAYLYTGTQDPYSTRTSVAPQFGLPAHKCHVYSRFNCGGFGGKTDDWGSYAALAMSKKVGGYPVLFKNTRYSNVLTRQRSFSIKSKIRLGGTKDGKITALDAVFYANEGANTGAPVGDCIFGLQKTWNIPHADIKCIGVLTNAPKRYYWRDVADPPGGYNTESALEKCAYKLGMNPLDFRLKNVNPCDVQPPAAEGGWYGAHPWGSFVIKELLEATAEWSDYRKKFHLPATKKVKDIYPNEFKEYADWYHGIALTAHLDSHGGSFAAARGGMLKANADGTFQVITGSARGTAGGTTVCCTTVAEVLGARDEDVLLGDWANTDTGLNPGVQASSSHTISISSAFYNAAMEMKYKMTVMALNNAAMKKVGATKDDLEFANSTVYFHKGKADEVAIPFASLGLGTNTAASAGGADGTGSSVQNDLQKLLGQRAGGAWKSKFNEKGEEYIKKGDKVLANGQSGACLELAIDPETGVTEFLNYFLVVDTGCTMFKQGALREIGAATELIHSQGYYFGDVYDEETGADISTIYTEAQFPTYMDMDFSTHHFADYQSEDASGTFGCHGIAEPSLTNFCTVALATFNAIGVWVDCHKGGFTPDRVLEALDRGIGADYKALMEA